MVAGGGISVHKASEYEPKPGENTKIPFIVYVVSFMAVIGGLLFGYDTGVVSGAMIIVRREFELNDIWQELVISVTVGAAAVFSLVGGPVNDWIGRRLTILSGSALFVVGAVVLAASPNRIVMLVGRIILGCAIGLTSMTVPAYVAECVPSSIRGTMVTCFQLMITFGFFIAGVLDGAFASIKNDDVSWRLMFGVAAVPALIQFVGFIFMPESPRWLVEHDRHEEAKKVLSRISPSEGYAEHELALIEATHEEAKTERAAMGGGPVIITMLKTPAMRRALTVGCLLQLFQQVCGINTVMYYSTSIIIMGGVRDPKTAIWFTCITSGVNFLLTIPGTYLIEKAGRRILLLGSMAGVIICLLVLGTGFTLIRNESPYAMQYNISLYEAEHGQSWEGSCDRSAYGLCDDCSYNNQCGFCFTKQPNGTVTGMCVPVVVAESCDYAPFGQCANATANSTSGTCSLINNDAILATGWCPTSLSWLPILGMVLYLCSFSIGFGGVPWTINSEIYPQWARSEGNACATATNWLFNLIVSLTFLTLATAITRQGIFFLYAGVTALGLVIFYFIVPETKHKSLEELEHIFSEPWIGKSSKTADSHMRLMRNQPPPGYDSLKQSKAVSEQKF